MTITFYVRRGSRVVKLYQPGPDADPAAVLDKVCEYFTIINPVCSLISSKTKVYLVFEGDATKKGEPTGGCFDILDQSHLLHVMKMMGVEIGKRNTRPTVTRTEKVRTHSEAGESGADDTDSRVHETLGTEGTGNRERDTESGDGRVDGNGERVAIVGSRGYARLRSVRRYVESLPEGTTVVSGGAKGVDTEAETTAAKRGLETLVFLPDWAKHGRAAGMKRNAEIVAACDRLVAFWDGESTGTLNAIQRAKKAGKPVKVFRFPPKDKA